MSHFTQLEKSVLLFLASIALLMFFFPLVVVQVPIAGEQTVSGYDIFSKVRMFKKQVNNSLENSQSSNQNPSSSREEKSPTEPEMPLSLQLAWLIPIDVTATFVLATITFLGASSRIRVSTLSSITGAILSLFAILHLIIADSDMHSWLASSFSARSDELKGNPFAAVAEQLGNLMLNAFHIRPGIGLYVLATVMTLGTAVAKSRILIRLRVVNVAR